MLGWMLEYWMLDAGCSILDAGYWILDIGCRYWILDCLLLDPRCAVFNPG